MLTTSTCRKCGKELPQNAIFCQYCGTKVNTGIFASTDDPYLGTTIDNTFVIESILGTGSMGIVYKARHRALDCYVAIKILKTDYLDNRVVLTRFQREAQAASEIQHQNVIRILHYGKTILNAPYIAMECLEGDDLSDIIVRDFPFSQARIANICLQVTRALGAAHASKIIHRDLKPANIKIVPQNDGKYLVKVLDFGIAKLTDERGEGLTREGAICGTPAFMSPEQVLGQPVSPASDIFSLGSIMYFMLTCKLPFQGNTMVDMASSILTFQPPRPSQTRIDVYVDPKLEEICLKALEKDASKRFQSAAEMERALQDALSTITEANSPNVHKGIVVGEAEEEVISGETQCAFQAYDSVDNASRLQNLYAAPESMRTADASGDAPKSSLSGIPLVYENDKPRDVKSDECTIIDQRAFEDDPEEGATVVHLDAVKDEDFLNSPAVPQSFISARASAARNNAVSKQPSDVHIKRSVMNLDEANETQPSVYASDTLDNEGAPLDPEKRAIWEKKRKLLFKIVGAVATISILLIIVVVLMSILSEPSTPPDPSNVSVAQDQKDEQPKAKHLSELEISRLSDVAATALLDEAVHATSYGAVFNSIDDDNAENDDDNAQADDSTNDDDTQVGENGVAVQENGNANDADDNDDEEDGNDDADDNDDEEAKKAEAEALAKQLAEEKEAAAKKAAEEKAKKAAAKKAAEEKAAAKKAAEEKAKKAAAKKAATKSDTSTTTKKAAEKASTSKTASASGSSSSSIKKKIAEGEKAEANGDAKRACSIYKAIVNSPDLSKEDRLMLQTKVRKCGRM